MHSFDGSAYTGPCTVAPPQPPVHGDDQGPPITTQRFHSVRGSSCAVSPAADAPPQPTRPQARPDQLKPARLECLCDARATSTLSIQTKTGTPQAAAHLHAQLSCSTQNATRRISHQRPAAQPTELDSVTPVPHSIQTERARRSQMRLPQPPFPVPHPNPSPAVTQANSGSRSCRTAPYNTMSYALTPWRRRAPWPGAWPAPPPPRSRTRPPCPAQHLEEWKKDTSRKHVSYIVIVI